MTRVALLWHMHQPYYEDLVTGEHFLPWVRLHALKDYWGMAALLEEFPDVRVTFNLVPSLLVQLEAFAANRARDRFLDVGAKPASELTADDVRFMLRNFFHAQRQRMIDVHPRYAQLLELRGWDLSEAGLAQAARRYQVSELRDLQVWQKLAWMDPDRQGTDPRLRVLLERGSEFTEEDKRTLRQVELELLNAVIPAYRRGVEAGRIEVSTSPFYHPILPLLCDTEIYKRTHPDSGSPRQRFIHPEDALAQLEQSVAYHTKLFGQPPVGLWPSEGSVSDAMLPLVARTGFKWMATDELILARTLNTNFTRDARGVVHQSDALYRPYVVNAGDASVACGFRDHALSDLIGFVYSGWQADAAADDFVHKLADAGRQAGYRMGGEEPTIFVILDGENAWEHFEGGGRPFLRALYHRLSSHPELRTVTMADACASPSRRLDGIFPGSWIDANFYIWIGHPDDQKAWSQVGDARAALAAAGPDVPAAALERARQELFIAEGSDWCWWYGDDHSSDHDAEFDDLFRRHLRNVYRLLSKPIPDELFLSNIGRPSAALALVPPIGRVEPTLDGEDSSYFEWRNAGRFDVETSAGAMHQIDRQQVLHRVMFGFGADALYIRVDTHGSPARLLEARGAILLHFVQPAGRRIECAVRDGRPGCWLDGHDSEVVPGLAMAVDSVLEIRLPQALLGVGDGVSSARFFVAVVDAEGRESERQPSAQPIVVDVPDARLEASNWTA